MTVTTALYRRYRPDSFADVIGQEHVTGPLMTALRKNRVNHAYLFSGPRGCGKTTSARILARCLNCEQGPTDTPCGVCPSCVELARGGSGSLDVIEIDAASHGGVDDARDLRERATFAPVRDRYKIFIIDEAHMVTSAGFNALLKIVEEPPEHIKFIFATTEPDKVIGTIRSRTHHYPFRLVPPEPLMAYLEQLCGQENVPVAPGVLSLVIRAGGGSVRDSLSVLDQLMAGAGPNGLDYELAVALLGYTHASLLDDVVEAVAASDAATVFRAVDRVIQTGHDPRRFVEDLLERFRDLIIVQAMPESAQAILRGMPADQIARLQNQAHSLGAAELSRAADVTNTALTEMTGATSPRLHLELLCARILLPGSDQNERGMAARIERVERRLNYAGNDVGAPAGQGVAPAPGAAPVAAPAPIPPSSTPLPAAADPSSGQAPSSRVPSVQESGPRPGLGQDNAGGHGPASAADPAAVSGDRPPMAAPRVSTNDWPVEQGNGRPNSSRTGTPGAAGTSPAQAPSQPPVPPAAAHPATQEQSPEAAGTHGQSAPVTSQPQPEANASRESTRTPADTGAAASGPARTAPAGNSAAETPSAGPASVPATPAPAGPAGVGDVEVLRRAWPDVLQTLSRIKRSTWALVEPNAQVSAYDGTVLTLSFTTAGLAGAFGRADHSDNLRQAIHKTVGIDCQINAVAAGAGRASAEPNPKAPVSKAATASSADVAWGLAPAPVAAQAAGTGSAPARGDGPSGQGDQPVAGRPGSLTMAASGHGVSESDRREDSGLPGSGGAGSRGSGRLMKDGSGVPAVAAGPMGPAGSAATGEAGQGTGYGAPGQSSTGPGTTVQGTTGQGATGQVATGRGGVGQAPDSYPDLAGDYSYSDDDWGPPRDEDAPPLEEEPPMDWTPSNSANPTRPANASGPANQSSHARGTVTSSAPAAPSAQRPETSGPAPAAQHPDSQRPDSQRPDSHSGAPHDPWTRAVEQAPGVWVVGTESNVDKKPAASGSGAASEGTSAATGGTAVPHYEPATAQIPPSIPVTAAAGQARNPDPAGAPSRGGTTAPAVAREYAMATVAPAQAPAPASSPAGATTSAPAPARVQSPVQSPAEAPRESSPGPAASARQSLYQRLSNSPEAEAGRSKAPARAATAAVTYVQDIPSADDETIEESGVFGRAAVERILGGKLIEERSADGSPIAPRY
ncbi:DNA polymerase III subunit gamma and tau [Pseudarthrobacter enclensis]|nr:DNA polymerase III subunit gamma and tau [Pseudarthrobacter enclensis]